MQLTATLQRVEYTERILHLANGIVTGISASTLFLRVELFLFFPIHKILQHSRQKKHVANNDCLRNLISSRHLECLLHKNNDTC